MKTRIVILFGLLLITLAWATQPFGATRTTTDEHGNSIRLTDEPCTATGGVFATMPDALRPDFRGGVIHWEGKDYAACWRELDGSTYFIVDESGDNGAMPKSRFKLDVEI